VAPPAWAQTPVAPLKFIAADLMGGHESKSIAFQVWQRCLLVDRLIFLIPIKEFLALTFRAWESKRHGEDFSWSIGRFFDLNQ
jgi:hypothetical protein